MSRLSPLACVMIERRSQAGAEPELVTEYFGSSLKGGRAFAQAILKAQGDEQAQRVIYIEMVKAEPVVHVSVPVSHLSVSFVPTLEEAFPF